MSKKRCRELLRQIALQTSAEAAFDAKCQAAATSVDETVEQIDNLEQRVDEDAELLKAWGQIDG
ncbi:hypothetical protein VB735_12490 [Halotia wernerae UHCC 0503]|nr:hypothetical protein [Halotia wernerae UHCC 0503]